MSSNGGEIARFFTVKQIAEMLDVHRRTVSRWIKSGALAAYRVRGVLRIAEADQVCARDTDRLCR
jgi:excisionase family DNA binding protein